MSQLKRRTSLLVIVPALNEEMNLRAVIEKLLEVLPQHWHQWEILIVNDGSTDQTGAVARECAKMCDSIRVRHHEKPVSLGAIFRIGLDSCRSDYLILIQGQNCMTIETMHAVFSRHGYDLVIPVQANTHERPFLRRLLSRAFVLLLNFLFGLRLRYYNDAVLHRTEVLGGLQIRTKGYAYQAEILLKLLRRGICSYCEVPIVDDFSIKKRSSALKPKNVFYVFLFFVDMIWEFSWESLAGSASPSSPSR